MPYPVAIDPKAVRALHTKLWQAVDQHLLWAFTPQGRLQQFRLQAVNDLEALAQAGAGQQLIISETRAPAVHPILPSTGRPSELLT